MLPTRLTSGNARKGLLRMKYAYPFRYDALPEGAGNSVRYGLAPLANGYSPFGASPAPVRQVVPVFRFDCSAGCPFPPPRCHALLNHAIVDACRLAIGAARRLEAQRDHAFTTHTYRHTAMGFLRDIEDMPNQFAYSKAFFDRWYRPEYTTLVVAGDVVGVPVEGA